MPLPVLSRAPPVPPLVPPSARTPAKLAVPLVVTVRVPLPRSTAVAAAPDRFWMVWLPAWEMSRVAPAPVSVTPLLLATLPPLPMYRVLPAPMVVAPV